MGLLRQTTNVNLSMRAPMGKSFITVASRNRAHFFFSFAQGEGAVVVVLKRLEDALTDNDHIYSVVSPSQQLYVYII